MTLPFKGKVTGVSVEHKNFINNFSGILINQINFYRSINKYY